MNNRAPFTPNGLDQIPHPVNPPIYNDIMWVGLFLVMALYLIWAHRNRTTLNNTGLMFIGAGSMFWQEYFNNWGGYLLYSPDLTLLPWKSTLWTSPNKPIFLIFSYGVFFTVIFTLLGALMRRVITRVSSVSPLVLVLLIAGPIFYGYNFVVDGASVDAGLWNYVDAIGPVVKTPGGGTEPLLWPAVPFAFYGSLMLYSLLRTGPDGAPSFLALGRPERRKPGLSREAVRALTSVMWWNGVYWFAMTLPVNLVRQLFGHPSVLVP